MWRLNGWKRLAFASTLACLVRSEEKSLLDTASVKPHDIDTDGSFGDHALIDGSFKTMQATSAGATREMVIALT